jgi:hypothetical protein
MGRYQFGLSGSQIYSAWLIKIRQLLPIWLFFIFKILAVMHCTIVKNDIRLLKKRPNFLNSAPTSIKSALRLLSAPSIRFSQQTAICPVSLWAFVVEIDLLNWARAHAVRQISDKVTAKELGERARVCMCVKCYYKLRKFFFFFTNSANLSIRFSKKSSMPCSGLAW